MPDPKIGSCVLLHSHGEVSPALVINVFPGNIGEPAMVSVAVVESGIDDLYGKKVEFQTSLNHESIETGGNTYWSHFSNPCTCKEGVLVIDPITGMHRAAENYEGP
jgi:hypothetical protein